MSDAQRLVPEWATEPIDGFIANVKRSHDFYHLTVDGLKIIVHNHHRVQELTKRKQELEAEIGIVSSDAADPRTEEEIRTRAENAMREVREDFPVLHQQQIVFMWGQLESLVEDILAAWLANDHGARTVQRLRKVRINVHELWSMSESERNYFIASELERDLRSSHKHAIDIFEAMLSDFGIGGLLDDSTRRNLIELANVRNVLLHRRGIVDSKFLQSCPWMTMDVGQPIIVDSAKYALYFGSVFDYAGILLDRIGAYFRTAEGRDKPRQAPTANGTNC